MNVITSILTIAISFSLLLIAYFKYMRNKPRLRIIKLNQSSASTFSGFNEKIKFNYKNEIFEEISAIEIIINNNGYRAIEKEDIRDDEPLEIYVDENNEINDFSIIKKHGSSNVELIKIDNHTLRLNIISFDKGSSIRVKLLCNKEKPKKFSRGKIIKADKSISRIKDLKDININNIVNDFFIDSRILLKLSFTFGFLFCCAVVITTLIEIKPKALIFAPSDFYIKTQQINFLESLISSANEKTKLELNIINNDTLQKSYEFEHVHANFEVTWLYSNDPIAKKIYDSLEILGYDAYYSSKNPDSYKDYRDLNNSYKFTNIIKVKETTLNDYKYSFIVGFSGWLGMIIFFHILFFIFGFKTIRYYFSYRYFLSEDEITEIREKHSNNILSKPFLLFFPK